jgi:hypothetical protein
MANPEEIKKLLDQINKAYERLGKGPNPFANFDTSNITNAKATTEQLEVALEGVKYKLELTNTSAKDLSDQLKSIVQEVKNTNTPAKDFEKSLKRSIAQAQKLKYEEEDISRLSKKQLEQIKEKLRQSKSDNIQNAEKLLREIDLNGELTEQKKIAQSYLDDREKSEDILLDKLDQRIKQEEKISKLMGLGGAAVEGTEAALARMGFIGLGKALGLDEVKEKMREIANSVEGDSNSFANKFKVLKGGVKEAGNQLKTSLKDPLVVTTFLVNQMIDALKKADTETGVLAKAFGTSYNEAANIRNELNTIANLSGNVNITTSALQKSLIAVNTEFGTATMFSGELLKDFTQLTDVAGYTNDAAARLSKISVATGTDLSKNTEQILGQAVAFNATNKLALNEKAIVEEVAKASKATTLSLGMQPKELTKAVLAAKALGSSLEKVEEISQSLLNFESSISSELEAELLTGKNLNLERARMYALNNDIEGVAREIAGQIGSAADFTKMNVIQQEALAKSVGMTREDLASSLIERQALSKIGEGDKTAAEAYNRLKKEGLTDDQIAAKLGDKKLADQLKSQSVQERFNASIEKLKEIFISLAEPILQIVSPFMDLLNLVLPGLAVAFEVIVTPIKLLSEGIGGFVDSLKTGEGILLNIGKILGGIAITYGIIKLIQLGITGQKMIQGSLDARALIMGKGNLATMVATAVAWTIMNPFKALLGLAIAGAVGAAIYSSMKDGVIDPKKGPVVSGEYGSVQLSEKDTAVFNGKEIIAGTNLGGKKSSSSVSSDMSRVEALLSQLVQKQDRPVQVSVEMDGEKVGSNKNVIKGIGNNSTTLGTTLNTNTYKIS